MPRSLNLNVIEGAMNTTRASSYNEFTGGLYISRTLKE
jgi:hypothetical protein